MSASINLPSAFSILLAYAELDLCFQDGKKLEEYNTALVQATQLSKAKKPSKRQLNFLTDWLRRPSMGNSFLKDREQTIWQAQNAPDLVTLFSHTQEKDGFTTLMSGVMLDIYHRIWGHRRKQTYNLDHEGKITAYDEKRLERIASILCGVIASLLPILAILALYFVKRMLLRIGLTIIFTAVFSLTISLFTETSKVNVFAATAAFAAVEVVFIGSATP
ncbi:hypothetical protein B0J14DRAFT_661091 [Halenospora varia]|nr:hypothetical protein B0J14DRAFT_661091 [Halenospora varia]